MFYTNIKKYNKLSYFTQIQEYLSCATARFELYNKANSVKGFYNKIY